MSIAVTLAFCQSPRQNELTPLDSDKISQEIEILIANFFSPEGLNYKNHVALRANKTGYIFAGDGHIQFTDYESYRASVESIFKDIKRFTEVKRSKTCIYVLAKDAASCTVEFKSKFLTVRGDTIVNNGCWTFVFKKFDDGWKTIQENGTHLSQN
jgi:hypothetical protein